MTAFQIRESIVLYIGLVLSVTVHEFGHAFVADKLGDDTPMSQGRVTLNPLAHMDPIGTVLAPLAFLFLFRGGVFFGWGKPVQINPQRFTRKVSMATGDILVSMAGPAMNVLMGFLLSGLLVGLIKGGMDPASPLLGAVKGVPVPVYGLRGIILLNFILAAFNLIPLPPLDGGHVIVNLLPYKFRHIGEMLEQYGMWILLAIMISGLLGFIFDPVVRGAIAWMQLVGGL